jgi:hypothetical protein
VLVNDVCSRSAVRKARRSPAQLPVNALPEADMREANVLDNIKRCSVVLTCLTGVGVRMDAQQPVVEYVRRRLAKRDHAPLGKM